jgi:hypothetical protein
MIAALLSVLAAWTAQPITLPPAESIRTSVAADGTLYVATGAFDGAVARNGETLATGTGSIWADVDSTGALTALFEQRDPGDESPAYANHPAHGVTAAVAAPAAPLGATVPISAPGRDTILWDLDVAPSGAAVAAWMELIEEDWHVVAAVRMPGAAAFGPPQVLSGPVNRKLDDVQVAAGAGGDAIVQWSSRGYGTDPSYAAIARGGRFSTAKQLVARAGKTQIAVGADGTAFAATEDQRRYGVRAYRAAPGQRFGAGVRLRCNQAGGTAIAPNGKILFTCTRKAELRVWEGRTHLKPGQRLSAHHAPYEEPEHVATDGTRAVVAWAADGSAHVAIRTGARFTLSTHPQGEALSVGLWPAGVLVLTGHNVLRHA